MTFDDIIMSEPKLKLGELIQLFLLGDDDKLYIDLYDGDWSNSIMYEIRIIDSKLSDYYDRYISYLIEGDTNHSILGVVLC